jgi:transposase
MSRRVIKRGGNHQRAKGRARREVPHSELKAILARAKDVPLSDDDFAKLDAAVDTLAEVTAELEAKGASVRRLRYLLFGPSTEKLRNVVGGEAAGSGSPGEAPADGKAGDDASAAEQDDEQASPSDAAASEQAPADKPKRPGHGRNGAAAYTGAERITVPHATLKAGDRCALCARGTMCRYAASVLVRVTGVAPIQATRWELEQLRCNACGEIFTAAAPEGVGTEKYDERAKAMIAMLRYGTGMPLYRLERFEASLGIPLPDATQWDLIESVAKVVMPVFGALIYAAAQGDVLHNDDTRVQILELFKLMKSFSETAGEDETGREPGKERTGKYTTGIVSVKGKRLIALFLSGRKHAGENLSDVLAQRAAELPPPIHMSDALSANDVTGCATLRGNCNTHARRNFVEVAESFPAEVKHVLEELKIVYANDDVTKREVMTDDERLAFHQAHSGPVMERLAAWLDRQLDEHLVEPNGRLGKAIKYMRRHWDKLTLFLSVPGSPLDNSICERAIKKAVLQRKNSLFYRTLNSARIGDALMSLIHTAELEGTNVFEYLVAILRHPADVEESPEDWLPWNYQQTLAEIAAITDSG